MSAYVTRRLMPVTGVSPRPAGQTFFDPPPGVQGVLGLANVYGGGLGAPSCDSWMRLTAVQQAEVIRQYLANTPTPAGQDATSRETELTVVVNSYCRGILTPQAGLFKTQPAGQAQPYDLGTITGSSTGSITDTADPFATVGLAATGGDPALATPSGGLTDASLAALAGNTSLLTTQQQTTLFNAIGSTLSMAGSTIAGIIQSGDATQRAALASQIGVRIATLQEQLTAANAAGNTLAAQRATSQLALLNPLHSQLVSPAASATMGYVVLGLAVAIAGGIIYVATKPTKRRASKTRGNPSRTHKRVCRNPGCGCQHGSMR